MDAVLRLVTDPSAWLALATLIVMEVVLGIDNLVFISLVTNPLPAAQRGRTRTVGIALALVLRLALLSVLVFLVALSRPLVVILGHGFSARDLILLAGGFFLVWKSTTEIHEAVSAPHMSEGAPMRSTAGKVSRAGLVGVIGQVLVLDLVFSVDSILTAIGMTDRLPIMMAAVTVAVLLMMGAAGPLGAFIRANPSVVMLALGFLLMIGMMLIADGWGFHVPKGYVYAAMAFAGGVEALNLAAGRRRRAPGANDAG